MYAMNGVHMSRINKQLNASNSKIYTPVFVESILKVNIPASIYLKLADHFDDKYINSTSDSWVFDFSGSRCYAHFRQDKISNQIIKYICFHYASAKEVAIKWSAAPDMTPQTVLYRRPVAQFSNFQPKIVSSWLILALFQANFLISGRSRLCPYQLVNSNQVRQGE